MLVAEARIDGGEAGAGLQISPNASHILLRWGLGPALGRVATAPTALVLRRWGDPRAFASMPFESVDSAPFRVALRADLHAALRETALASGAVEIREDLALENVKTAGDRFVLGFRGAGEAVEIETSCLIGADGQRSAVRKFLGDARDLDSPGWEAWRTLIPAEGASDTARAHATNLWLGRDSHAVHYPVAAGALINLVVIKRSAGQAEGWARIGDRTELQALVAAAAPPLRALIEAAPNWTVWTLRDRAPSLRLAKGAAALVGDAAHPLLPFLAQGAAMAIEDAAVLAAALPSPDAFSGPAIEAGLAAYAAARASRVYAVFKAARSNAFVYHLPAPAAWLRDRRIAAIGPDGMRRRYAWLYDWRAPAVRP